jgi:hypothetical protein
MGQLLQFPTATPSNGGKARILRRRAVVMVDRKYGMSPLGGASDLTQDHADPETDTRPSELA